MRRIKPVLLRLAVVLGTALPLLGIAEWVARRTYGEGFAVLVDVQEDHSYRPMGEYEHSWGGRTIPLYTNSLGWKDARPGRVVEKEPAGERIVFLGDSFTEGVGFPQEETVSGLVGRALGPGFEVENAGRISYSPLLEYQRLKKFFRSGHRAGTVVLLHDISDVLDELGYGARYQFAADGEPERFRGMRYQPLMRWVYNHSALVRALRRAAGSEAPAATPPESVRSIDPADLRAILFPASGIISKEAFLAIHPAAHKVLRANWMGHPPSLNGWAREGLASSFGNLLRIRKLAAAHGARLLVVIYPWPQHLYTREDPALYAALEERFPGWFYEREFIYGKNPGPRVSVYQREIERFCRANGIPFLDLTPDFAAAPDWPGLFFAGDVHFDAPGNRLSAEKIAERLGEGL
jgi:lysophospholipase L1-like esterase